MSRLRASLAVNGPNISKGAAPSERRHARARLGPICFADLFIFGGQPSSPHRGATATRTCPKGWRRPCRRGLRRCRAASLGGRCTRCLRAGRHSAAATGFGAGLRGAAAARRPLRLGASGFAEIESGAAVDEDWAELGLDPRVLVTVRARSGDTALKDGGRRDWHGCAGCRGAGDLGRSATARSCHQPRADDAAQASGVTGLWRVR